MDSTPYSLDKPERESHDSNAMESGLLGLIAIRVTLYGNTSQCIQTAPPQSGSLTNTSLDDQAMIDHEQIPHTYRTLSV